MHTLSSQDFSGPLATRLYGYIHIQIPVPPWHTHSFDVKYSYLLLSITLIYSFHQSEVYYLPLNIILYHFVAECSFKNNVGKLYSLQYIKWLKIVCIIGISLSIGSIITNYIFKNICLYICASHTFVNALKDKKKNSNWKKFGKSNLTESLARGYFKMKLSSEPQCNSTSWLTSTENSLWKINILPVVNRFFWWISQFWICRNVWSVKLV